MKLKLTLLFFSFLFLYKSQAQNIPFYAPKSGIELWYSLNNGIAADSSGNMRDGVLSRQNKVAGRNGCLSSALQFNHDGDSLGVHYGNSLFSNQFTISLWCNANPLDTNVHSFISWNDSLGGMQFGMYNNQILFDYNKFGPKVTGTATLVSPGFGTTKNWHHYVLSYSLGATRIYIDTVLKIVVPGIIAINPFADIIIGNSIFGEYAGGDIEDFGWWSRALTNAEIQSLYFNQPITGNVTFHNALCGNLTSSAAVHVSGANLQHCNYNWQGTSSVPLVVGAGDSIISSVSDQFTVFVEEQNDRCLALSLNLSVPSNIQIQTLSQTSPSCYGDSNATVIEQATGGTLSPNSTYQYSWTPQVSINDTAYHLTQGTYYFHVMDDNGCVSHDTILVTAPQVLHFGVHRSSLPSCVYSANGNVQAIADGGTAPYYYVWGSSNGAVTAFGGNALYCANGTYTVYVTDAHNCFLATTDTFNQKMACIYPVNIPPYMSSNGLYAWYPFNNNTLDESGFMNFGSNFGGTFVPNRSNCTASAISLNANTGIIQDSVSLGTGYAFNLNQFSISAWLQTNKNPLNHFATIFSNLNSQGNGYWIGVWNDTIVYDLNRINGVLNPRISQAYINPNKPSLMTVTYDANVFQIYIDSALAYVDSNVVLGLAPNCRALVGNTHYGEYYEGVLDDIAVYSRVITASEQKLLYNYSPISASGTTVNNVCGGASDGKAFVSLNTNGHVPNSVVYNWTPNVSSVDSAVHLLAGNYQCVVVADYMNCASVNLTINQPTPIQVFVDSSYLSQPCAGMANGFLAVHAGVGGVQPYNYVWSNGAITPSIQNLTNGTYSVLVSDANNCHAYDTFHVVSPSALQAVVTSNPITCGYSNDANLHIGVSGGVPQYHYVWTFNSSALSGNTSSQANLAAGNYSCIITDSNVCSITILDTVLAGPAANFVLVEPKDTLQFWTSSLSLTVTSNSMVNYQWQVDSMGNWVNCRSGFMGLNYTGVDSNYLEIFITALHSTIGRYRCILSDSLCSDTTRTASVDFEFEGVANLNSNTYKAYWTTDAHQQMTVVSNDINASNFEIRNSLGQLLLSQVIHFGVNQVSASELMDGFYVASITNAKRQSLFAVKLVK